MPTYFGVDGCRAGWVAIGRSDHAFSMGLFSTIEELWEVCRSAELILVDIPIGLPDGDMPQRDCDVRARKLLGWPRRTSVFPPPCREALATGSYREACECNRAVIGRGLSRQSWGISGKIREVDELLRRSEGARKKCLEMHPEVCFWSLAGGKPMQYNKKKGAGFGERLDVLESCIPGASEIASQALSRFRRSEVAPDDIADAVAGAVTGLLSEGRLRSLPGRPPRDAEGLPMRMVYY
jgi:predicted RNase H-like nuclease